MTLPTFLGIGAPRAGSTWLYNLLLDHPQVYVSRRVKEIAYFNHNYHMDRAWYESFFPVEREAAAYRALGEVTPGYLYCDLCPQRIGALLPNAKLLLILRNPVDRAWSHYMFRVRLDNYQGSFENFLIDHPGTIKQGLYARHIKNYLRYFERDALLVLFFEQVFSDVLRARGQLSEFLEIDPGDFPDQAGSAKINRGYIPRFGKAYALSTKVLAWASKRHQYWLIEGVKRAGMKKALEMGAREASVSMNPATRDNLRSLFSQDIRELEELLEVDLNHWLEGSRAPGSEQAQRQE